MSSSDIIDILLVEDDPYDVELTLRAFKKHKIENPVFVVKDGEEALDFIFCRGAYKSRNIGWPPKVILLDLKLPKIGGLDVLRAIKNDERTRLIPVVIVTSSAEDPDIKTAYALGANSYVVKPIDTDVFFDTISNIGLYWLIVNRPPI